MPDNTESVAFTVHSAARGPRWVGWVSLQGEDQPWRSVILVARNRQEAEERARAWIERTLAEDVSQTRPTEEF